MENFNDADFDIPQTDPKEERDKQIKLLRNEIQFLKSELNMGAKMQGLVGGSAIGYALGMGGLGELAWVQFWVTIWHTTKPSHPNFAKR
jgi:hypothetical protein